MVNLEDSDSVLESLETTVLKEKILAVMEINETGVGDRFVEKTSQLSNEKKKKEHLIIYFCDDPLERPRGHGIWMTIYC